MCTTAATWFDDSWHLIKTRDPVSWMRWDDEIHLFDTSEDTYKKWIVQNPDLHQDGYYGGINEKGVAFVSTYVHVDPNQISYIRRPYVRLILEAATAKEAVGIIKAFNPRIGGNMFVADTAECFGIEGTPQEYFIETIEKPTAKTNHYVHLDADNLNFNEESGFEAWSKQHLTRATELIQSAKSLEDLKRILTDRKHVDVNQAICTTRAEEKCFTHSAMIFDTKLAKAYYAQGNPLEVPFNEFGF